MRIGVGDGTQTDLLVLSDAWDGNHARHCPSDTSVLVLALWPEARHRRLRLTNVRRLPVPTRRTVAGSPVR